MTSHRLRRPLAIILLGITVILAVVSLFPEIRLLLPPWVKGRPAISWVLQLRRADDFGRWDAADALGEIGPMAAPGVPYLIKALESRRPWGRISPGMGCTVADPVPNAAREAIVKIGPAAIPSLAGALKNPDPLVRVNAAWALWQLQGDEQVVLPVLIDALYDKEAASHDRVVRMNASQALGEIGRSKPDAVFPALVAALNDRDDEIVCAAIKSLAVMAVNHEEAVKAIITVFKDGRMGPWHMAYWRLGELGPVASPCLIAALKDVDPRVREGAASSLFGMESLGARELSALKDAEADRDPDVRKSAALAIERHAGLRAKTGTPSPAPK